MNRVEVEERYPIFIDGQKFFLMDRLTDTTFRLYQEKKRGELESSGKVIRFFTWSKMLLGGIQNTLLVLEYFNKLVEIEYAYHVKVFHCGSVLFEKKQDTSFSNGRVLMPLLHEGNIQVNPPSSLNALKHYLLPFLVYEDVSENLGMEEVRNKVLGLSLQKKIKLMASICEAFQVFHNVDIYFGALLFSYFVFEMRTDGTYRLRIMFPGISYVFPDMFQTDKNLIYEGELGTSDKLFEAFIYNWKNIRSFNNIEQKDGQGCDISLLATFFYWLVNGEYFNLYCVDRKFSYPLSHIIEDMLVSCNSEGVPICSFSPIQEALFQVQD